MARVCGSSEAADQVRYLMRTTMVQLRNEYMAMKNDLHKLEKTCQDSSFETARYMETYLYGKLVASIQEIEELDKQLKAYSLFVQSIDNQWNEHTSQCSFMGNKSETQVVETKEKWHKVDDEKYVFDSPDELAGKLDTCQGKDGLTGSCGICSVENAYIISGGVSLEKDVYRLARGYNSGELCAVTGGTTPESRQKILELLGVKSTLETQTIDNIAVSINSGRIPILSVDARKLYGFHSLTRRLHAVVVTSVSVDASGNVTEVTICDSNAFNRGQTGAHVYAVQHLKEAMTDRMMNVTEVIR